MKAQLQEIFSRPDIQQQIQQSGWQTAVTSRKTNPTPSTPEKKDTKTDDKNWWDVV